MTDTGAPPPYPPPPGHPGGPPYPPPPPGRPDWFAERLRRRPEPRFTAAASGAGMAIVLLGIVLWGATYFGHAGSPSTDRNLLGAGLGAVTTILGVLLAIRQRQGPLATAGVVAAGIGLPLTLAFATLDFTSLSDGLPVNLDLIFWVSVLGWGLAYTVVPGMRGHTFFVFLVAVNLVDYVLVKSSSGSATVRIVGSGVGPRFTGLGTVAAIGMIFGLGYYVLAFLLDRAGRHGPATGLIYPAFTATGVGIAAWAPDLHQAGTGIVTILVGGVVCWYGGRFGRRFSCFAAAAAVVIGLVVLVDDATKDGIKAGVAFVIIGVIVVGAAAAFASDGHDPHDMDPEAIVRAR